MSVRYFTADFHLGMSDILRFENRPFKTIEDMNKCLLSQCIKLNDDDIVIHAGDLYSFKADRANSGIDIKPAEYMSDVKATFINVRGNHDVNNKVKSVCSSMRTSLGKVFPDVSISHYPSYDKRCKNDFLPGDIHLCGHVHKNWKYCLDTDNKVLNVNIGVDAWNYKIISEQELIKYIWSIFKIPLDKLFKVSKKELYEKHEKQML